MGGAGSENQGRNQHDRLLDKLSALDGIDGEYLKKLPSLFSELEQTHSKAVALVSSLQADTPRSDDIICQSSDLQPGQIQPLDIRVRTTSFRPSHRSDVQNRVPDERFELSSRKSKGPFARRPKSPRRKSHLTKSNSKARRRKAHTTPSRDVQNPGVAQEICIEEVLDELQSVNADTTDNPSDTLDNAEPSAPSEQHASQAKVPAMISEPSTFTSRLSEFLSSFFENQFGNDADAMLSVSQMTRKQTWDALNSKRQHFFTVIRALITRLNGTVAFLSQQFTDESDQQAAISEHDFFLLRSSIMTALQAMQKSTDFASSLHDQMGSVVERFKDKERAEERRLAMMELSTADQENKISIGRQDLLEYLSHQQLLKKKLLGRHLKALRFARLDQARQSVFITALNRDQDGAEDDTSLEAQLRRAENVNACTELKILDLERRLRELNALPEEQRGSNENETSLSYGRRLMAYVKDLEQSHKVQQSDLTRANEQIDRLENTIRHLKITIRRQLSGEIPPLSTELMTEIMTSNDQDLGADFEENISEEHDLRMKLNDSLVALDIMRSDLEKEKQLRISLEYQIRQLLSGITAHSRSNSSSTQLQSNLITLSDNKPKEHSRSDYNNGVTSSHQSPQPTPSVFVDAGKLPNTYTNASEHQGCNTTPEKNSKVESQVQPNSMHSVGLPKNLGSSPTAFSAANDRQILQGQDKDARTVSSLISSSSNSSQPNMEVSQAKTNSDQVGDDKDASAGFYSSAQSNPLQMSKGTGNKDTSPISSPRARSQSEEEFQHSVIARPERNVPSAAKKIVLDPGNGSLCNEQESGYGIPLEGPGNDATHNEATRTQSNHSRALSGLARRNEDNQIASSSQRLTPQQLRSTQTGAHTGFHQTHIDEASNRYQRLLGRYMLLLCRTSALTKKLSSKQMETKPSARLSPTEADHSARLSLMDTNNSVRISPAEANHSARLFPIETNHSSRLSPVDANHSARVSSVEANHCARLSSPASKTEADAQSITLNQSTSTTKKEIPDAEFFTLNRLASIAQNDIPNNESIVLNQATETTKAEAGLLELRESLLAVSAKRSTDLATNGGMDLPHANLLLESGTESSTASEADQNAALTMEEMCDSKPEAHPLSNSKIKSAIAQSISDTKAVIDDTILIASSGIAELDISPNNNFKALSESISVDVDYPIRQDDYYQNDYSADENISADADEIVIASLNNFEDSSSSSKPRFGWEAAANALHRKRIVTSTGAPTTGTSLLVVPSDVKQLRRVLDDREKELAAAWKQVEELESLKSSLEENNADLQAQLRGERAPQVLTDLRADNVRLRKEKDALLRENQDLCDQIANSMENEGETVASLINDSSLADQELRKQISKLEKMLQWWRERWERMKRGKITEETDLITGNQAPSLASVPQISVSKTTPDIVSGQIQTPRRAAPTLVVVNAMIPDAKSHHLAKDAVDTLAQVRPPLRAKIATSTTPGPDAKIKVFLKKLQKRSSLSLSASPNNMPDLALDLLNGSLLPRSSVSTGSRPSRLPALVSENKSRATPRASLKT